MYKLEFNVNPTAKGRPRFARMGKFVRAITPEKTRSAEAELRWLMSEQFKAKPLEGAITLAVDFYFMRPKSISEKKRPHMIVKPDLGNVLKTLEDAGNGILWRDDSQIINISMRKLYGDSPKIKLTFAEMGESA